MQITFLRSVKLIILILFITVINSCKKETTPTPAAPTPTPSPAPNYTNFKITSVILTQIPFVNSSSASWDLTGGPDVFFNMEDASNNVLMNGVSARSTDISPSNLPLTWNFTTAYQITNLAITHFVTVYDYDTPDPNDLIGYVGFTLANNKSGYPTSISSSNGGVNVTIVGSWY